MNTKKRLHYIPQFMLKYWSIDKNENVYLYDNDKKEYSHRMVNSVAYKKYLYSYQMIDLFGVSENIRNNFENYANLQNYDLYDNSGNLIDDKIIHLCSPNCISKILCDGKELTRAEKNEFFQYLKSWKNNQIEDDLSKLESEWKKMFDILNKFYYLYTKANENLKKIIVQEYLTPIKTNILNFAQFQYIRNPQMKKDIDKYSDKLFNILDNYNTQEDKEKVINCVYKDSISIIISNQINLFKNFNMELILLNENQNILLTNNACFIIQNKFVGVFRLQEGIYFPMTPKIILRLNKFESSEIIQIIENVKDYIVDSLNMYSIQHVRYFFANFNVSKKYHLDYNLKN